MKFNFKGVTLDTWIRSVVLIIALISQFLVMIGKRSEEIDISKTTEIVTYIFTTISAIWAWWKNNSFTHKAQVADFYIRKDDDTE